MIIGLNKEEEEVSIYNCEL